MCSFSTFKDKRYWILLIPAITILLLLAFFTPEYIQRKPFVGPIIIFASGVLFWSAYHLWTYFGDIKKKNQTGDNPN